MPNSFWGYKDACELVGARYPAAPLGLITVAALLPQDLGIQAGQLQHGRPRARRRRLGRLGHDRRHAQPAAGLLPPDRSLPRARQAGRRRRPRRPPRARIFTRRQTSRCWAKPKTSSRISSPPGNAASAPACSPPRNSRSTSPRRRCRASTCSNSTSTSTSASSIRAAARSPASSATSSSSTAACRALRPTTRSWRNFNTSTISAIAATSILSTTT